MEYWRQQDATPDDLAAQGLIARYIRDVGLDIARDCGELRDGEPEYEFRLRAREANVRLDAYLKRTSGLSLCAASGRKAPRQGGLFAVLLRFLGGR